MDSSDDSFLTMDVNEFNNFVCIPSEKAAYVVIEAIDVFPQIRYAYQTPGVVGGITIVVNERIQTKDLTGPSGWRCV